MGKTTVGNKNSRSKLKAQLKRGLPDLRELSNVVKKLTDLGQEREVYYFTSDEWRTIDDQCTTTLKYVRLLKKELANTKQELANTGKELANTKQELANTVKELAATKQKLADNRGNGSTTLLNNATNRIRIY